MVVKATGEEGAMENNLIWEGMRGSWRKLHEEEQCILPSS
jgi:hypothetical protein